MENANENKSSVLTCQFQVFISIVDTYIPVDKS